MALSTGRVEQNSRTAVHVQNRRTRRNRDRPPFVTKAPSEGETSMNRNVTISLGALIVIIIIVALVF